MIGTELSGNPSAAVVPLSEEHLEQVEDGALQDAFPSAHAIDFDPLDYLEYLPDLEAEVFWLIRARGKTQADVAALLKLSQPTISYRFRRAVVKIAYLVVLTALDVRGTIDRIPFLDRKEKAILADLFYYLNQQAVARKHRLPGHGQSSVKWVALKTRRNLERLERADPAEWSNVLGLIYLLFRNLGIRLRSE